MSKDKKYNNNLFIMTEDYINNRINNRNNFNINDLFDKNFLMDRDFNKKIKFVNEKNHGEITGEFIDDNEIDRLMYKTQHKLKKDNNKLRNDFDIFDKDTNFNVSYNESNLNFQSYDTFGGNKILKRNEKTLETLIDEFSLHVFNLLKSKTKNTTIIFSPFNLVSCLACLMTLSKQNHIYKEISTIFNNIDINNILDYLSKYVESNSINYFLVPEFYQLNLQLVDYLDRFCRIQKIDISDKYSTMYFNNIIKEMTKKNISQILTKDKLSNSLMSLNCFYYKTKWKTFSPRIIKDKFNGKITDFMMDTNCLCHYSEYNGSRLLELELEKNKFIGFLIGDKQYLNLLIENLDECSGDLRIPIFTVRSKYNMDKILSFLGLDLFSHYDFEKLTNKIKLGSVIQEIKLTVKPSNCKGIKNISNKIIFNLNNTFTCYLRKEKTFYLLSEISTFYKKK